MHNISVMTKLDDMTHQIEPGKVQWRDPSNTT